MPTRLLTIDRSGRVALTDPGDPARLVLATDVGEAVTLLPEGALVPTGALSPWFRDMALTPAQIEPVTAGDVLAVSSAGLNVPNGSKVLFESTPSGTGAVLEVVATGQGSGGGLPAPGSAAIHTSRTRTAPAGFLEAWTAIVVDFDNFAGDAFPSSSALIVEANQSAAGPSTFDGVWLLGNADGNGATFFVSLAVVDSDMWLQAFTNTPGLPASNVWIYTLANFAAGEPSGYVRLTSGDADAAAVGNIEFQPGINSTVPAGPHGSVAVHGRAAAQIPFWVRGFAGQTANLQEWRTAAALPLSSIGAAGQIINEPTAALGVASSSTRLQRCRSSASDHAWTEVAVGSALADESSAIVLDPDGNNAMELRFDRAAGLLYCSWLGGVGATSAPRPGQLTDNTTGLAGTTIDDATGLGTVSVATVNDNFKRLLDRVNVLEELAHNQGFLT